MRSGEAIKKTKCLVCGREISTIPLTLGLQPSTYPQLCQCHKDRDHVIVTHPESGYYLSVPVGLLPKLIRQVYKKNRPDWSIKQFVPPGRVIVTINKYGRYHIEDLAKEYRKELEGDEELRRLRRQFDNLQDEIDALLAEQGDIERQIDLYPMQKARA